MGVAPTQDPPPYSLLTMASPPPQSPTQHLKAAAQSDETYSTVGEDVYSEPASPVKGNVAAATGGSSVPFLISRNESYGSLPNPQLPHYATPTSTLRYIPEVSANSQSQEEDEYEPIIPHLTHGKN